MNREAQIAEEAAAWIDRLNQPAMDASAGPDFDAWMRASPRHREIFAELQALWHSESFGLALEQASTAVPRATPAILKGRFGGLRQTAPWFAAVASAALLVAFLSVPISSFSIDTYRSGPGSGKALILADGSRVNLSGNSELRVGILPWQRNATLVAGEAYFDVHHETSRIFHVSSGATSVRVLGTAFSVDRQSSTRTAVEVYRGAVQIEAGGAENMVLRKGDSARVIDGHIAEQPRNADLIPEWRSGWFEASNVPLSVLIEKAQRYSKRPIVLRDPALLTLPISGRFHIADTAHVLDAIRDAYKVDVAYGRNGIELRAGKGDLTGGTATM